MSKIIISLINSNKNKLNSKIIYIFHPNLNVKKKEKKSQVSSVISEGTHPTFQHAERKKKTKSVLLTSSWSGMQRYG